MFAITFAMLLLVWHEHHTFFGQFGLREGVTIWLNGLLLFVVLVYIYPPKVVFAMIVGFTGAVRAGRPRRQFATIRPCR